MSPATYISSVWPGSCAAVSVYGPSIRDSADMRIQQTCSPGKGKHLKFLLKWSGEGDFESQGKRKECRTHTNGFWQQSMGPGQPGVRWELVLVWSGSPVWCLVAPVLSGHVSPMLNLGQLLGHVPGQSLGVLKMSWKIHVQTCFNRGHRTLGQNTLRTQF